jgi:drug/metabolite transporter (DMT)-like permease
MGHLHNKYGHGAAVTTGLLTALTLLSGDVSGFMVPKIHKHTNTQLARLRFNPQDGEFHLLQRNNTSVVDPFQLQQPLQVHDNGSALLATRASLDPPESLPHQEAVEPPLSIWAARGILLLVAMIWATNFPAVKYLEHLCFHPPCNHPPSEFALARFGVAAVVSFPLLVRQRWDVIAAGFECGLFITLGYITQAVALESISAGKCAFICSLTVVVVPLLAALLEGKPIKPINLVAATMALCGVGLLEGLVDLHSLLGIAPAVADTSIASSSSLEAVNSVAIAASGGALSSVAQTLGVGKGDIIALGQPLGFGYAFMRIEHYVEKFKDVNNRVLTITAAQCVAVGFVSLLWVLYDFHGIIPDMGYLIEPHRIGTIAWTGIVTTVIAIYLEGIALQKASATDAALIFSSEPVWASMFAMMLLHEKLGLNSYIGGAVILFACVTGAMSDLLVSKDDVPSLPEGNLD